MRLETLKDIYDIIEQREKLGNDPEQVLKEVKNEIKALININELWVRNDSKTSDGENENKQATPSPIY